MVIKFSVIHLQEPIWQVANPFCQVVAWVEDNETQAESQIIIIVMRGQKNWSDQEIVFK